MEIIIREDGEPIIPHAIWKKAQFTPGDHVTIEVKTGKIVISSEKTSITAKFRALANRVSINDYHSDEYYELELNERLGL